MATIGLHYFDQNEKTTANMGLAKAGEQWLIEVLCFYQTSVLANSLAPRIRHLRQAPNRWR